VRPTATMRPTYMGVSSKKVSGTFSPFFLRHTLQKGS